MTLRPLNPFKPFDPFKYGTRTLASQVRALFANGEQGAIYGTDFSTLFQDAGPTNPVTAVEQQVGYRLDMSGRGNHLVQPTATKRAYVSRKVNLLTKTEDFNAVEWLKINTLAYKNVETAPDGTFTANKLVENTSNSTHIHSAPQTAYVAGTKYIASVYEKKGERTKSGMGNGAFPDFGSWHSASFDLEAGTGVASNGAPLLTITPVGDGWYKLTITLTPATSGTNYPFRIWLSDGPDTQTPTYLGDGTSGVYVWGASLTLAIDSHLPYQRVNTATDYDDDPAKFPTIARYDGIDDSASSSTGGGGTAGFFFSSAITVSGGAGTNRVLFSDAGTNTGYIVRINASNQLELAAGNGTAYTTVASVATLTAPVNAVVQAWDDGTNLNVRINDGVVASVARPTVSAGTAGYTIGQDNGASTGYFNGREYSTLYRKDSGLTADQRDQVRRYQLQQARFV